MIWTLALVWLHCTVVDPWCHLPMGRTTPAGDGCNTCTVWREMVLACEEPTDDGQTQVCRWQRGPYYSEWGACTLLACSPARGPDPPRWWEEP